MLNVIEIVVPVFLVIGLGYAVRELGLVGGDFFTQVNKLVYYVCLPLLLVYKIAGADFSTSFNFKLVIATSGGVACCFVIAFCTGNGALFLLLFWGLFVRAHLEEILPI